MAIINEVECGAAGVSAARVRQIATLLERAGRMAHRSGLTVFGGSGSGDLRARVGNDDRPLILATFDGNFDGGDGACRTDDSGLMRGE